MTVGWSCCWPARRPLRTAAGCWSSTIRATGRTARRPRTWAGSGWAGTARPYNGMVTVTTVRADEQLYYPVHACRTPRPGASRKARATRRSAPSCRSARTWRSEPGRRGFVFRAVAADSAYGDQDGFRGELAEAGLPFVMALKPRRGTWAYSPDAHTPVDAARDLAWGGPDDPGDWQPVTRTFRDGHNQTWPPRTRPPCWTRPPGTWSRTCPGPAARTRKTAPGRPRA